MADDIVMLLSDFSDANYGCDGSSRGVCPSHVSTVPWTVRFCHLNGCQNSTASGTVLPQPSWHLRSVTVGRTHDLLGKWEEARRGY